jgi:hypothetical protein
MLATTTIQSIEKESAGRLLLLRAGREGTFWAGRVLGHRLRWMGIFWCARRVCVCVCVCTGGKLFWRASPDWLHNTHNQQRKEVGSWIYFCYFLFTWKSRSLFQVWELLARLSYRETIKKATFFFREIRKRKKSYYIISYSAAQRFCSSRGRDCYCV